MKKTIRTMAIASFLAAGLVNGSAFAQVAAPAASAVAPSIQPLDELILAMQRACAVDPTSEASLNAIVLLLASYPGEPQEQAVEASCIGAPPIASLATRIADQRALLGFAPGDVGGTPAPIAGGDAVGTSGSPVVPQVTPPVVGGPGTAPGTPS